MSESATAGLITVAQVTPIEIDLAGLSEAASLLARDCGRLTNAAADADHAWARFPEAFWMPGAAESIYGAITPAHQAALDLRSSARSLLGAIDAAEFGIQRLRSRRLRLIEAIEALHTTAPLQIDAYVLERASSGSIPLDGV